MTRKFCIDCEHCIKPSGLSPMGYICGHVDTRTPVGLRVDCGYARAHADLCGSSGRLFEPRKPDQEVSRWFRRSKV